MPANNFSPEIAAFKAENVEIVLAVIPGPDFTVFLNQAAQQGLKPKIMTAGKVGEFPQGVYPYGDRAINMLTEVWWSKYHPYASGLTGQSSMEYATEYEKSANKQASMGLGFRHSLIEVAVDTLKRSQKLDDPGFDPRCAARDGLQVDRRADQLQNRAVSQHQRDQMRRRTMAQGQEMAAGTAHRR